MRKLMILIAAGIFVLGVSAPALAVQCTAYNPDGSVNWPILPKTVGSCFVPIFYANGEVAIFKGKGTNWEADDGCEPGDKFVVKYKCKGKAIKKVGPWTSANVWRLCICHTPPPPVEPSAFGPYGPDVRAGNCKKNKLKVVKFKLVKAGDYGLPVWTYIRMDGKEPWEMTKGNNACAGQPGW